MIFKCPRCGTEYFQPLEACDWCPGVEPIEKPREPIAEEDQTVGA